MLRGRYLSNYTTDWIKTKLIRKIGSKLFSKVSLKIQVDESFPRIINWKIHFRYIRVYILGSLSPPHKIIS